MCDGQVDCSDRSDEDEADCSGRACEPGRFRCSGGGGQCVDGDAVCDGEQDCLDGSDESMEACKRYLGFCAQKDR